MTKRSIIRKQVRNNVYPLMRKAWPAMRFHIMPHSESQDKFLDLLSDWVYTEYGQYFTTDELEENKDG
jgi:hypothetical protein